MGVTRRELLKLGVAGVGVVAYPHILSRAFGARTAAAMGPADPYLLILQWEGGNDGLNTVIPMGGLQRTEYDSLRPGLGIPVNELGGTQIDDDPDHGSALALHPVMDDLHALYTAGKVAVINGVGYPEVDGALSHFRSEAIWFEADPYGTQPRGWFGAYLDDLADPSNVLAVSFDKTKTPVFATSQAVALGFGSLDDFRLPDDPLFNDLPARQVAWNTIYDHDSTNTGLIGTVAQSGQNVINMLSGLQAVETSAWGSNLEALDFQLSRRLFEVASLIRHDVLDPSNDTGLRFFHARLDGFDTHSRQEGSENRADSRHGRLLLQSSQAIKAFYDDMVSLGVSDRVLIMTFSEFGRRPTDNDSDSTAGTDHGTAAPLFLIGDGVNGGVYGGVPDLQDLVDSGDQDGNLRFHTDFRQVYTTVIDRWLASDGAANQIIPNASPGEWSAIPGVLP